MRYNSTLVVRYNRASVGLVDVVPYWVSPLIGYCDSSDHPSNAGEMLIQGLMVSTEYAPGCFSSQLPVIGAISIPGVSYASPSSQPVDRG